MNDLKDLLHARLFLLDMDGTLYLGRILNLASLFSRS